jgi:hypothetical protein
MLQLVRGDKMRDKTVDSDDMLVQSDRRYNVSQCLRLRRYVKEVKAYHVTRNLVIRS